MTEAMREQFEAWARSEEFSVTRNNPLGQYDDFGAEASWDVWQAALRSPAVAGLAEAAKAVAPYVVSEVLEHCDGNKCREQWCAGCMGEEHAEASVEKARDASSKLYAALAQYATLVGESHG